MGYRGKLAEQNGARALRAQGWTLTEIAEELGVSRSSASLWCRDVEIDEAVLHARRRQRYLSGNEGARRRGPNKLQRAKHAEIERFHEEGRRRIGQLSERDLLIAGLMLYVGEGSKTDGAVKLANSDPRVIRLHLRWLRHFFEIDERRLRVSLYLHRGLDLDAAVAFWSGLTEIPPEQFTKPYRAVPDPSIRRSKHPMGCPAIVYSCTRTHREVMGMAAALLS
jgi:transcriptional regulator with XRE-family HTH domain